MGFPVLLTVGVLGAGWVALQHERVKPNKATVGGPAAGAIGGASSAGVTVVDVNQGSATVDDTTGASGADPSTSPASPATTPGGPAAVDAVSGVGGFSGPPSIMTAPGPSPKGFQKITTVHMLYGSETGITRKQESHSLGELGPANGMVW